MVEMLQKYYKNETDITADEIEAGYQIFIHAGDKANYYKSDEEIKQLLPDLAEKIRQGTNIAAIVSIYNWILDKQKMNIKKSLF